MVLQLEPSQVALPFVGVGHAVHDEPQFATSVSLTHVLPQRWNPALQMMPQFVPSQVAAEFAGIGHAVHDAPQRVASESAMQVEPQRW